MIDRLADTWHAADGWPIRRVVLPCGGEERGSLLFLAGRGDFMEKYAETMQHWADRGWMVDSFDWRGQGGSGRFVPDPWIGHVDDFACWFTDLEDYCAHWRGRTSAPHVIVAHSMGGHILLRALAEGRVTADAAVLIAPMLGIGGLGLPHVLGARIAALACALGHSGRAMWRPRGSSRKVEELVRHVLTHSVERYAGEARVRREQPELVMGPPSWGWLSAAFRSIGIMRRPGYLERVTTPVMILATTGDRLVSTPAIARMARRLPHVRLHHYGRHVAHEILREVDDVRDDALARIDAFLAEYAPSSRRADAAHA